MELLLLLLWSWSPAVDGPDPWVISAVPAALDAAVAPVWQAVAQSVGAPADPTSQVLTVESGPVEPAVPLKLSLQVQVFVPARAIEITATLGKRPGFPAPLFLNTNVTARITLPPGLQLEAGDLTWSGDLKGDQVARFVATVRALHDIEGVVEAAAIGHAVGGRVDADRVRFHVVVRGGHIGVGLTPVVTPPELGPGPVVPRR